MDWGGDFVGIFFNGVRGGMIIALAFTLVGGNHGGLGCCIENKIFQGTYRDISSRSKRFFFCPQRFS